MSAQKIIDTYEVTGGWIVLIEGGKREITKANMAKIRQSIPRRGLDSIPRHESGGMYTGDYPTNAHVIGYSDDGCVWEDNVNVHMTCI